MSGILFDPPGLRFLRRFRFFETMMRTFASSLLRWLSARACGWRQLHFRLHEAEFSSASQSACKLFEWTLGDSHAADGASIDALRPSNNWVNLKAQHELLLIRETLAPFAWRVPTPEQWPRALSTGRNESSDENILAASRSHFWKWQRRKIQRTSGAKLTRSMVAIGRRGANAHASRFFFRNMGILSARDGLAAASLCSERTSYPLLEFSGA